MKIRELKLYSSNIDQQVEFYTDSIGLNLIEKRTDVSAKFLIGNSILELTKSEMFKPYHFAINIPANKEKEALNWLKQKVEILKYGNDEIQSFDFWNAKAMYFYDKDKNIVELIARKNLRNESREKFNSNSLLEISEIGLPVSDIEATFDTLSGIVNIHKYDGGFKKFCAIGDENGLFICINKNVKDWFPTGDKAYSADFEIKIEVNKSEYKLEFSNEQIKVLTNNV